MRDSVTGDVDRGGDVTPGGVLKVVPVMIPTGVEFF